MAADTLTLRRLNRATLARQMLLERFAEGDPFTPAEQQSLEEEGRALGEFLAPPGPARR
jgi:hypothetical protein